LLNKTKIFYVWFFWFLLIVDVGLFVSPSGASVNRGGLMQIPSEDPFLLSPPVNHSRIINHSSASSPSRSLSSTSTFAARPTLTFLPLKKGEGAKIIDGFRGYR